MTHTIVDVTYGDEPTPLKQCVEHGPACRATDKARRAAGQPTFEERLRAAAQQLDERDDEDRDDDALEAANRADG